MCHFIVCASPFLHTLTNSSFLLECKTKDCNIFNLSPIKLSGIILIGRLPQYHLTAATTITKPSLTRWGPNIT